MYEQLIEIVKQAGAMIREAHEAEIPVYDKEGIANFVTKYDKDVQSFLIRNFRQLLPGPVQGLGHGIRGGGEKSRDLPGGIAVVVF